MISPIAALRELDELAADIDGLSPTAKAYLREFDAFLKTRSMHHRMRMSALAIELQGGKWLRAA